uniref:hypothetical protein n=1 Tax=Pedobacter schmidteae TaxID=2201271 RepID=UPI000EB2DEC3|nr:hypothetical protein [Pedobacter schmidteae]
MKQPKGKFGIVFSAIVLSCIIYALACKATVPTREIEDQDPGSSRISKTFAVNASDKVILDNQYGTLNVKTWNKNEVKLDVMVVGGADLDERKLLEIVDVRAVKKEGAVVLETRLKRKNGNKFRITFQVYMPESNSLALSHQYGNVSIGDFTGAVVARIQYGNFIAGELKNSNNDLSISYGSTFVKNINNAKIAQEYGDGLTIGNVGSLVLNAAYAAVKINAITEKATIAQEYGAGLNIGSVRQLVLNAAYADVNIGSIKGGAKIAHQYSDLNIDAANELNLTAQYSNVKIGRLNGDAKLNIQYNSLMINDITTACQDLNLDCGYVRTQLKFNNSYNGNLDAQTNYLSLKYGPRISARVEQNEQNKRYTGKIGSGGSSNVKLVASYGSVMLN